MKDFKRNYGGSSKALLRNQALDAQLSQKSIENLNINNNQDDEVGISRA